MKNNSIVSILSEEEGFAVLLDGAPLRTPAGHALIVPSAALATHIAKEWEQQEKSGDFSSPEPCLNASAGAQAGGERKKTKSGDFSVNKRKKAPQEAVPALSELHREGQEAGAGSKHKSTPLTALAALAIDVIATQRESVENELLAYGETDQLLYREDREAALQELQRETLDTWVAWAESRFGVKHALAAGIMPVRQPEGNHAQYQKALRAYNHWQLAALAAITKPTCSLILALAVVEKALTAEQAFALSRLDEEFQAERWGEDEEAAQKKHTALAELTAAGQWLALL